MLLFNDIIKILEEVPLMKRWSKLSLFYPSAIFYDAYCLCKRDILF